MPALQREQMADDSSNKSTDNIRRISGRKKMNKEVREKAITKYDWVVFKQLIVTSFVTKILRL